MSASNFMENTWLDHVFGNTPYSAPATIYISLHTADPGEDGTTGEVSGNAYARASLTNNGTNFPAASGGVKATGAAASFPTPTPSGWGDVTHFALWDAATTGNCLAVSNAFAAQTINAGNTVSFASGALTITAT